MIADYLVKDTLDDFILSLQDILGPRLAAVILYGSVVFDDLAPGYGDLDFIAVVKDTLSETDAERLIGLRKMFRDSSRGILPGMLEGAFLPESMLDPTQPGLAVWWGTSGVCTWQTNKLGWFTLYEIREYGIVLYGEDIRQLIPLIHRNHLLHNLRETCQTMKEYGKGGTLHAVDWLLTAARGLLFLKEGRLCSKSEAADWAVQAAQGMWKNYLPAAKQIRLEPRLAREQSIQTWLEGLNEPIQMARLELEAELAQQEASL